MIPFDGRRGLMLVLSSPSGAGKTTLARALLADGVDMRLSVSVTTRAIRPGERDGEDYRFVDDAAFDRLVAGNAFLEWARVFDHRYGTPAEPVARALAEGRDILFDIDWQGTQQLKERARDDVVSVFILPPSLDDLKRRLESRAQDGAEVIAGRMARAASEIGHWAEYDYVLVNDDFDRCLAAVRTILSAERMRRARQPGIFAFVRSLLP
jgi:guanylate kinase